MPAERDTLLLQETATTTFPATPTTAARPVPTVISWPTTTVLPVPILIPTVRPAMLPTRPNVLSALRVISWMETKTVKPVRLNACPAPAISPALR